MDAPRARSHVCPVAIGRRVEIELIRDRLVRAAPGVVLVAGEAGIGKSRLIGEAIAAAPGVRLLRGACFEADAELPFAPVRDLLRSLLVTEAPSAIAALAGPYAASLVRLMPELAAAIGPNATAMQAAQDRRDLFDALDRVFAGVAASSPPAIVVEDLHWSDAASLDFFLFLARRSAERPLPLIATYRSDEVGPDLMHFLAALDRERLAVEMPLSGLTAGEVDAMLRAIFGLDRPAPAEAIHLLTTLTEGNPFFIEEILTSLGIDRATGEAAEFRQLRDLDALPVPRSVQDAVRRRTARLSEPARRVLALAAVAGRRFSFSLLLQLSDIDEEALLTALAELVAARLIVEESAEHFVFRHALTRQAVYAELLTRTRRLLHLRVGETLERQAVDAVAVADLAYHFFAAAAWERALVWSQRAGEVAMALHAPAAAIAHFSRALEAERKLTRPPDPALLLARGSAHEQLGEFERALADYRAARELARNGGAPAIETAALLSLGLLWAANDYDRVGEAVQEALAVARSLGDDVLIARCLNRLGNWHLNSERPGDALRCHLEAIERLEAAGDRHGVAETLDLLGVTSFVGGDLERGTHYCRRAIEVWRETGDRRGLSSSLVLLPLRGPTYHTDILPALASPAETRTEADAALEEASAIGWRAGECWALWTIGGMNLGVRGIYGDALATMEAALRIAEEIEHRQWLVAVRCTLGNIAVDLLDRETARRELESALSLARETGSPYWARTAAACLASALVAEGELDAAGAVLGEQRIGAIGLETIAQRLLWRAAAELALARQEPEEALGIVERLEASAAYSADRPAVRLEKLRGEVLLALDRFDEAERALRRALVVAEELDTRPLLWRIQTALAACQQEAGRTEEAALARAAALAIVEQLAATLDDVSRQAAFLTAAPALIDPEARRAVRRRPEAGPGGLTAREREVAQLLTRGLSNREIAAELFVAEWTAATHVRNILAKLELTSRTQIAAWAVAQGIGE